MREWEWRDDFQGSKKKRNIIQIEHSNKTSVDFSFSIHFRRNLKEHSMSLRIPPLRMF